MMIHIMGFWDSSLFTCWKWEVEDLNNTFHSEHPDMEDTLMEVTSTLVEYLEAVVTELDILKCTNTHKGKQTFQDCFPN